MLRGTIIENSLNETGILANLNILKSWQDGSWKLYQVEVSRERALGLGKYLTDGPWYIHFWEPGKDEVLVVFKDKTFDIKFSDKATWNDAMEYGRLLGIPEEQLDFPVS